MSFRVGIPIEKTRNLLPLCDVCGSVFRDKDILVYINFTHQRKECVSCTAKGLEYLQTEVKQ
jgi:hypothetical protein